MPELKNEPVRTKTAVTEVQPRGHSLALKDRHHLAVTGVTRVISCDEGTAVLETPLGNLTIGGQELQVSELSVQSGQVQLSVRLSTCNMPKTGSRAAVCWPGSFADYGGFTGGYRRCGGCVMVSGTGVPAGELSGPGRPCAGGGAPASLLLGCDGFCGGCCAAVRFFRRRQ